MRIILVLLLVNFVSVSPTYAIDGVGHDNPPVPYDGSGDPNYHTVPYSPSSGGLDGDTKTALSSTSVGIVSTTLITLLSAEGITLSIIGAIGLSIAAISSNKTVSAAELQSKISKNIVREAEIGGGPTFGLYKLGIETRAQGTVSSSDLARVIVQHQSEFLNFQPDSQNNLKLDFAVMSEIPVHRK